MTKFANLQIFSFANSLVSAFTACSPATAVFLFSEKKLFY